MIKVLVAVDSDLASSIALRYGCQLANLMEVELQTIHVKEPGLEGPATGAGWARRTWEKELLQKGKDEIAQLLKAESSFCPVLSKPLIVIGDREEEILHELQRGAYDLFVEGIPSVSSSSKLYQKIHSSLYQHMGCPFILVKNLLPLQKVLLLLSDEADPRNLISTFLRIFRGAKIGVDLLSYKFQQTGLSFSPGEEEGDRRIKDAGRLLASEGWTPDQSRVAQGPPAGLAEHLQEYGLVLAAIDRSFSKKSQLLALLDYVSSPVLVCW
jgi:hypothetical protein